MMGVSRLAGVDQVAHDYVRDVELSFDEWTAVWEFLTKVKPLACDRVVHSALTGMRIGRPNFRRCKARDGAPV